MGRRRGPGPGIGSEREGADVRLGPSHGSRDPRAGVLAPGGRPARLRLRRARPGRRHVGLRDVGDRDEGARADEAATETLLRRWGTPAPPKLIRMEWQGRSAPPTF